MIVQVRAKPWEIMLVLRNLRDNMKEEYCILANPFSLEGFKDDPRVLPQDYTPSKRNGEIAIVFGMKLYTREDIPVGYVIILPERERKKFNYNNPSSRQKIIQVKWNA